METNDSMTCLYDLEPYSCFMLKENSRTYQVIPSDDQEFLAIGNVRVKDLCSDAIEFFDERMKVLSLEKLGG